MGTKRRFTRKFPCFICGGYDEQERGFGKRCFGFLSADGNWAHCTREEYADGLQMFPDSETYGHKVYGHCKCGVMHNPRPDNGMMKHIIKEYDYMDENGELLFQVCRTSPKGFFQRRPDGKGGWINNLKGVRPVIYRLPELLASDKSEKVFICEGEKDVDALRELGLVATTNAGGAGNWRHEHTGQVFARPIVILPDNDEAGRDHTRKLVKSLYGAVDGIQIVRLPGLPEGGDVSDWIAAGGTVEQLHALVDSAAYVTPYDEEDEAEDKLEDETESDVNDHEASDSEDDGWICAADVEPELVEWLWKPYIAFGNITLFDGDPGIGKSWVTCALASAMSKGKGLPDVPAREPQRVLMLSAEDGLENTIRPRLDTFGADVSLIHFRNKAITFDKHGLEELEAKIIKEKPALVIIDPLFAFVGGKLDIHRDNEVRSITTPLTDIARRYNCAIVALRHLTKQQQKAIYAGGGSIAVIGSARSALLFGHSPDDSSKCGFIHAKANLGIKGAPVGYKIEPTEDERGHFEWTDDCDLTAEEILGAGEHSNKPNLKVEEAESFLCEILENGAQLANHITALAKKKRISASTLRRAKKSLQIHSSRQKGVGPWWWKLPDDEWQWETLEAQDNEVDKQSSLPTNEHVAEGEVSPSISTVSSDAQQYRMSM